MIYPVSSLEILEDRITPAPVFTALNLVSGLNGENGFSLTGGGGAGVNVEIKAVANAGDVNGDGIKDLLVGVPFDSSNSKGRVALIFGKAGGFPTNLNLDALGTNGVLILGQVNFDYFGKAVAGVGDVNNDGYDDFVVGAPGQDGSVATERGAAYVIFGKASWGATLGLNTLDGTNGFKIVGDARRTGVSGIAQAVGGYNLAGAGAGGDFNGDGFDDILIGAQDIKALPTGGDSSGAAFIVFGQNTNVGTGGTPFASTFSVTDLVGGNGLMVASSTGSDFMGSEVGFMGDVNGDGLTDLSIGNMANPQLSMRRSFIIFGKATGNPPSIDVNFLTADQGFAGPEPTAVNFVGPISYGSEFVLRDIDSDGDQDLGVSFVHQQFLDDAIQGYTFVKNTGSGYTTNPFGNLAKEVRQALLGFSNVSVDAFLYDLGDFNGDGFYDIASFPPYIDNYLPNVFYGEAATKTYLANNGTDSRGLSFTGLTIPPIGSDDPQAFFIGDISGDGIDDVLVLPTLASSGVATAPNAYLVFGDAFNPSSDGKSVTLRDIDGDTVTVKTSAGQFTRDMFTFSHPIDAVQNGQRIDLLDLTVGDANSDAAFSGANLTVSVKKGATGDGRADFGAINATGIDLGSVIVAGGLGSIDAGNGTNFDEPGLNKLDVYRFGRTATGPVVPSSDIVGRIGSIIVDTEFDRATLNVSGAATEGIGTVTVTGNFSGVLNLAGPLGTLKTADLLAGAAIDVNGTSDKKTTITAKAIANGVVIDLATTLGKLTATQVGTATINAARIDTISVTGDTKVPLPGSFAATVRAADGLGTMTVKENFSGFLDLAGPLGTFKAADLAAGAKIDVNGTSTAKTNITAKSIANGVVIDLATTLGRLAATQVGTATITAARIDTISVTGDTKAALPGSFAAAVRAANGLGSITVKENFSGNLDLTGTLATLGTFKAFDVLAGAVINVDGPSTKKTSITAHVIHDGVTIDVASVIGKLSAAQIGDATIIADRIDSLSVTGDTKLVLAGDLAADITLDNAGATGDIKALGTAKIAGRFHDAKIIVAGSVGSFSAGAMQTASLFAGYTPTNAAQPLNGGTFVADALHGTFTITGKVAIASAVPVTASMDDSFVVATNLGTNSLAAIDSTTGALAWGFAYRDAIKSLKVKDPLFAYDVPTGGTQPIDDFSVRVLV